MEFNSDQHKYESLDQTSQTEQSEAIIPGIDVIEVLTKIASITGSKVVVLEDGAEATQVYPTVD